MEIPTRIELIAQTITAIKTPTNLTIRDMEHVWNHFDIKPSELVVELKKIWQNNH